MRLSDIKVNPDAVQNGEWVKEIPEFEDLEVQVRGFDSSAYRLAQAKKIRLLPRGLRQNPTPEVSDRMQSELLYEVVLLDWKNLIGDDGKPIVYSKEKAKELLADPQYRALRDAVAWAASVVGADRGDAREAAAKN